MTPEPAATGAHRLANPRSGAERRFDAAALGATPFLVILAAWWLLPHLIQYPPYMLPSIGTVLDYARESIRDGSLARDVLARDRKSVV